MGVRMTALPPRLETFLGATARQLIDALPDADQRAKLVAALEVCASTLVAVDAVDLDRFELIDLDLPDLSVWNEAAPQVAGALRALHLAVEQLELAYPAPPPPETSAHASADGDADDLAFDVLGDDDEGAFGAEEAPVRAGPGIDRWVEAEDSVERAVSALVAMLHHDVLAFGRKLRAPALVSSRFALLGELQEFRARSVQCLEAIAAAVLKPLGPHHLTALLPRYSSELQRSLTLRDELALLQHDVSAANERMPKADAAVAAEVVAGVSARLDAFAAHAASRHLWARDKRELVTMRLLLRGWAGEVRPLRTAMEGFTRFLELLVESVSRRPEVEAYDRENAELGELLLP